mgnify:CR=1 FL=1
MKENKLNICQVTLFGNINIIKENLLNFNKLYGNNFHYIICPKKEKILFSNKIKEKNCIIFDENKIIPFKKFKKIANKYLKKKPYFKKIQKRLGWYYQQILKLTFVLNFTIEKRSPIIIWDADTIILKKILFFEKKNSICHGTTSEFHKAYYLTNKALLNNLPKYFISSLCQFSSITLSEADFLIKKLIKIKPKNKNIGEWITNVIFKAITSAHKEYNGSMFSEYELIGQSKLLKNYKKQKLISGVREHLNGKLSKFQKNILIFLGFSYLAYEHTHPNSNSFNMLKRNQTWLSFLKIILKKTSNKFFRGIKYNLKFIYYFK